MTGRAMVPVAPLRCVSVYLVIAEITFVMTGSSHNLLGYDATRCTFTEQPHNLGQLQKKAWISTYNPTIQSAASADTTGLLE